MVESALSAATVGPLHAAATKPVILLEGKPHTSSALHLSRPMQMRALCLECRCIPSPYGHCWREAWSKQCLTSAAGAAGCSCTAAAPRPRSLRQRFPRLHRTSCFTARLALVDVAGVNHAQFGDDKRNAARGDIEATVSLDQAQHMIAQVTDTPLLADIPQCSGNMHCSIDFAAGVSAAITSKSAFGLFYSYQHYRQEHVSYNLVRFV